MSTIFKFSFVPLSCFYFFRPLFPSYFLYFSQILLTFTTFYRRFVHLSSLYMFLYVRNIFNNLLIILLTLLFKTCILSNVKILLTSQQINKQNKHIFKEDVSWQSQMVLKWFLTDAGMAVVPYEVKTEPTLQIIDHGRDIYVAEGCDCTIALGGGSVVDAAKVIGMLAVNGGDTEDYQMRGKAVTVEPPLFIAIPTTSGTGAEATKTSVVINNNNHLKKSLYHNTMIADVVVLDPSLTLALPARITAATGMDALSHAIESYVSLNATPITEMYGLKAIELVNKYLEEAYRNPDNLEARAGMMLASYFGGVAITAGIGIAHIMAQPLGGEYGIPHGDACSIFLPASIILNQEYAEKKYVEISKAFGVYKEGASDKENVQALLDKITSLQKSIDAPRCLKGYIKEEPSMDYLIDVIKRTTGHITCNPRPLNEELMKAAYELAMKD